MAEAPVNQTPSLSEDYLLEKKDNQDTKPIEVKEVAAPAPVEEPVPVPAKELPVEEKTTVAATEENTEASAKVSAETPVTTEESTEAPSATEDNNDEKSDEQEEAAEETPEIKIETVPADFRFPTTNQTRHCFTRYVEYHRCVAAKGEGAPECDKFAKYYRSLCPSEWVERWNEQRENGTFPGPL